MKRNIFLALTVSVTCLIILAYIEQFIKPGYLVKSICKIVLLCFPVVLYSLLSGKRLIDIIRFRKLGSAKLLYIGMLLAYLAIIAVFMVFRRDIDINNIRENLMSKEHLTQQNCLYVFLYIIIVNSFIEEAFFRGFIYHLFDSEGKGNMGIIISAVLFALYHIGIVSSWFNPLIFVLCIAGLAGCGIILQWVSLKYGTLKASWLIHACANLAINTIGILLIFKL